MGYRKSRTCLTSEGTPRSEYDTKSCAVRGALLVKREHGKDMTPYLCDACRKWHLCPTEHHTPSFLCLFCAGRSGEPKDTYRTEQDARRRALIIRERRGVCLECYRCRYGLGWHLTKR